MTAASLPDTSKPATPTRRRVRIWLIVETILCIPTVLLGAAAALMSPMMFDAPGSTSNPQVVMLFWSAISFPFVCILGVVAAWIAFARRSERTAMGLSLLPVIPLVTGLIALF